MMQDQQLPKPSKPAQANPPNDPPKVAGEVVVKPGGGASGGGSASNSGSASTKSGGDQLPPPAMKTGSSPTKPPATASAPAPAKPSVPALASASAPQPQAAQQSPSSQPAKQPELPPTSLTALSSMSSTQLPQGAATTVAPQARPQVQNNPNLRANTPASAPATAQKTVAQNAPRTLQVQQNQGQSTSATPGNQPPAQPQSPGASPASSPPPGASPAPAPTKLNEAKPKKSFLKFLPFIGIGLVLLLVVGFVASRFLGVGSSGSVDVESPSDPSDTTSAPPAPTQQVSLEYWGLWEPSQVLEQVLADFEKENPGMSVRYTKQSHKDYRERLQTAIASGNGPDVFRYHATWVPMMRNDLQPLPDSVITATQLREDYYRPAGEQLQSNGQPVGVPLMYEGLALLYNKDIFDTAGEAPPTTWAELRTLASKLTVMSGATLQRGGIALGNSTNVDHFSDILGLLLLQNGADPSKPHSNNTMDALSFYTNFQTADAVWNDKMPTSTVAFARGDVAMIFAPSWRIHDILAMNPKLNFGVAPIPKLSDQRITWANYWAEGVSARSQKKDASYVFLKYLSQPEVLEKLYGSASQIRAFGELYPRKDMADKLADDEYASVYLQDAPYSTGWYLSSATHDNGINDQLIKYYSDAVTAIVGGKKAEDVITTIDLGTSQVLRQYNVGTGQAN